MLSIEEKVCNAETYEHKCKVSHFINMFIHELLERGEVHDNSKLESPEVELFTKVTSKLAGTTFGSEEYNKYKEELGPALEHHYSRCRHHPEHFANGVSDMNLLDLVEMFCDWKASSLRHKDGNLLRSIDINSNRFNLPDMLKKIFQNTAQLVD